MGMKADAAEAMRWYEKAAAQGDEFAIERLQLGELSY
jgi:TPR repeat protein